MIFFVFKIRYFEKRLSKSLKKINFIFLSNSVPFNGQDYEKQNESETSEQLLFTRQNKLRKNPLLPNVLPGHVIPDQF